MKDMRIIFKCTTNANYPYVNVANFLTKDGKHITIDRCSTEYSYDETTGKMNMEWRECYIWDGETENFDFPENILDGAVLEELEVEDDAPDDYQFKCIGCFVNGKRIRRRS